MGNFHSYLQALCVGLRNGLQDVLQGIAQNILRHGLVLHDESYVIQV